MTKHQISLVAYAGLMIAAMLVIIPAVSAGFDPLMGYLSVLIIYWFGFCLPVAIVFGRGGRLVGCSVQGGPRWVPALALGLPILIALAAGTFVLDQPQTSLITIAIGVALINGPFEELAWRRTFRMHSGGALSFELLGLLLFAGWHVPLLLAHGVSFDHGALGLVGGAAMLGAVWLLITRKTNSVGWPMISHALVNMAAFVPHFHQNFVL
jgi:membrane protease YdiL (CAAX protease family)